MSLENQAEVAVFTRALFVCNKWDAIEPKEADEVKSLVIQTLKQTWPSVNLEAQIIFMSLRHCEKGQDFGIITTQFADFMKSIQTFILSVIDAKLQTHWR